MAQASIAQASMAGAGGGAPAASSGSVEAMEEPAASPHATSVAVSAAVLPEAPARDVAEALLLARGAGSGGSAVERLLAEAAAERLPVDPDRDAPVEENRPSDGHFPAAF